MSEIACRAALCYNEGATIVVAGGACDTPARIHSWRNVPMDTLPPHADNGNLSLHLPDSSGVYKIICTANKRIYVGSALNLRKRQLEHFNALRQNKHHNRHLQRAWNKYGEQVFTFEVLELVLPMSLTTREQYWFNKLKPFGRRGFNIAKNAGSTLGVKASPETRVKLKGRGFSEEHRRKIGEATRRRVITPETRAKLSNRPVSAETREKLRQANLGKKMSPEAVEKTRQANLGRKLSPEHIEKVAASRRGKPGHKNTPEQIEKFRQKRIGHEVLPETRAKLRQANIGKKHTPGSIEKMRQAQVGKKLSPEHIEKVRQAHIGRKQTEEQRRINSESHKGLKHSEETRRKMSEAQKGRATSEETRRKLSASFKESPRKQAQLQALWETQKGKPLSEETRRKISETKRRKAAQKQEEAE